MPADLVLSSFLPSTLLSLRSHVLAIPSTTAKSPSIFLLLFEVFTALETALRGIEDDSGGMASI